jgi:CheY-like chemotaxis protein
VSTAHFNIHELERLRVASVDAALAYIERDSRAASARRVSSLERAALFACMAEQSLPVPLALIGASTLLIIDDEPAVLRSMVRVLRQAAPELKLLLADNGNEGLALAGTQAPGAILVDAYMPELRGVEVCARLRESEATRHLPLVAMSADPTPELARAFERAGVIAFFEKPVAIPALFTVLSTELLPELAGD